jgi:hypothetical protein
MDLDLEPGYSKVPSVLLQLVGALGSTENGQYQPKVGCSSAIVDLFYKLKRDPAHKAEVALHLGTCQVMQTHLIPLLLLYRDNPRQLLPIAKLMELLTSPLPDASRRSTHYHELLAAHQAYKESFVSHKELMPVIMSLLASPLTETAPPKEDREAFRDHQVSLGLSQLLLCLLRNLLKIPDTVARAQVNSEGASVLQSSSQTRLVSALAQDMFLDILSYLMSTLDDSPINIDMFVDLTILDILHAVFAQADPRRVLAAYGERRRLEQSVNASFDKVGKKVAEDAVRVATEASAATSALRSVLAEEKKRKTLIRRSNTSRHANFGGKLQASTSLADGTMTLNERAAGVRLKPQSVSISSGLSAGGDMSETRNIDAKGSAGRAQRGAGATLHGVPPTRSLHDGALACVGRFAIDVLRSGGADDLMVRLKKFQEKAHYGNGAMFTQADIDRFATVRAFFAGFHVEYEKRRAATALRQVQATRKRKGQPLDAPLPGWAIFTDEAVKSLTLKVAFKESAVAVSALVSTGADGYWRLAPHLWLLREQINLAACLVECHDEHRRVRGVQLASTFTWDVQEELSVTLSRLLGSYKATKHPVETLGAIVTCSLAYIRLLRLVQEQRVGGVSQLLTKTKRKARKRTGTSAAAEAAQAAELAAAHAAGTVTTGNSDDVDAADAADAAADAPRVDPSQQPEGEGTPASAATDGAPPDPQSAAVEAADATTPTEVDIGPVRMPNDVDEIIEIERAVVLEETIDRFASANSLDNLRFLLEAYRANDSAVNRAAVKLIHTVSSKPNRRALLWSMQWFVLWNRVLEDPAVLANSSGMKELADLANWSLTRFFEAIDEIPGGEQLVVESLFRRTREDASYLSRVVEFMVPEPLGEEATMTLDDHIAKALKDAASPPKQKARLQEGSGASRHSSDEDDVDDDESSASETDKSDSESEGDVVWTADDDTLIMKFVVENAENAALLAALEFDEEKADPDVVQKRIDWLLASKSKAAKRKRQSKKKKTPARKKMTTADRIDIAREMRRNREARGATEDTSLNEKMEEEVEEESMEDDDASGSPSPAPASAAPASDEGADDDSFERTFRQRSAKGSDRAAKLASLAKQVQTKEELGEDLASAQRDARRGARSASQRGKRLRRLGADDSSSESNEEQSAPVDADEGAPPAVPEALPPAMPSVA